MADRKQEIFDAALKLADEKGLEAVSMRALAERAGVPIGTIYQFFPDKDAVVGCIFAAQMEEALRDVYLACNPADELEAPAAAATSIMMTKYHEWRADPVMAGWASGTPPGGLQTRSRWLRRKAPG